MDSFVLTHALRNSFLSDERHSVNVGMRPEAAQVVSRTSLD